MNKALLLSTLLGLAAGSAGAEWLKVQAFADSTLYVFPAAPGSAGPVKSLWFLSDYRTPRDVNGRRALSSKARLEYDCKEERSRVVALLYYEKGMGEGAVVEADDTGEDWHALMRETVQESMWRIMCK